MTITRAPVSHSCWCSVSFQTLRSISKFSSPSAFWSLTFEGFSFSGDGTVKSHVRDPRVARWWGMATALSCHCEVMLKWGKRPTEEGTQEGSSECEVLLRAALFSYHKQHFSWGLVPYTLRADGMNLAKLFCSFCDIWGQNRGYNCASASVWDTGHWQLWVMERREEETVIWAYAQCVTCNYSVGAVGHQYFFICLAPQTRGIKQMIKHNCIKQYWDLLQHGKALLENTSVLGAWFEHQGLINEDFGWEL